jgi:hypothetical protein
MGKSKIIILWGNENILSLSIEMYLSTQTNWQVVRASTGEYLQDLLNSDDVEQQEFILIHHGPEDYPPGLPKQVLQEFPEIKVIMICLGSNLMEVHSKQKILAKDHSDLIKAIEDCPLP